jgi:hypothetical protein
MENVVSLQVGPSLLMLASSHGRDLAWEVSLLAPNVRVVSHYRSGALIDNVREFLDNYSNTRCDFVSIIIGSNNFYTRDGQERDSCSLILTDMEALILRCKSVFSRSIILVNSILPRVDLQNYNEKVRYVNRHLKTRMEPLSSVIFVNHSPDFFAGKANAKQEFFRDGSHLNYLGRMILVDNLMNAIFGN